MKHERQPLNYHEEAVFKGVAEPLHEELKGTTPPTDGWDTVPRPNLISDQAPGARTEDGKDIPAGHSAFMGDFGRVARENDGHI